MTFNKRLTISIILIAIIGMTIGIVIHIKNDNSANLTETRVYENEQELEDALNNGEDVTGCQVTFTAGVMNPGSPYGYVIYSGKKLNFCSANNPGITPGSTVYATILSVKNVEGNWIIEYSR